MDAEDTYPETLGVQSLFPDDDPKPERECLERFRDQRKRFRAIAGDKGVRKFNHAQKTMCLNEVHLVDGIELFYVCQHVWVDISNALERAGIEKGELFEFKADVYFYQKGQARYKEIKERRKPIYIKGERFEKEQRVKREPTFEPTSYDYGLRRVGCVRRIEELTQ